VFLVDKDAISEQHKDDKANAGVQEFVHNASRDNTTLHLSVITIGELRQGVERIRHRGEGPHADRLGRWLTRITNDYADVIFPFDEEAAQIWGRLRVPHPENL
jgi:hypothetical protein